MEEERVIRLSATDEPLHRVENVLPRRLLARVLCVVGEHDNVFRLVVKPGAEEGLDVSRIVDCREGKGQRATMERART